MERSRFQLGCFASCWGQEVMCIRGSSYYYKWLEEIRTAPQQIFLWGEDNCLIPSLIISYATLRQGTKKLVKKEAKSAKMSRKTPEITKTQQKLRDV